MTPIDQNLDRILACLESILACLERLGAAQSGPTLGYLLGCRTTQPHLCSATREWSKGCHA